ncbi:DUF4345 family protein [Rhodothalassium salexigens]|uniref:DUF4345 family protein n=1 Tax=Rhodothalassium salexigens TaxID=1086 RepID=UPI001912FCA8|nr:DUF4345 family protein [Rhodothalassium salexigens]
MSLIPRIILALMALYCAGQALAVFNDPVGLGAWVGYSFEGASGRAEFLALYGGFFLGLAGFFGYGVIDRAWRAPGLCVLTVTMLGAGGARAVAIASTDTAPVSTMVLYYEIAFALAGAVGWWLHRRTARGADAPA